MKLLPLSLPPLAAMDRLPLSLPFTPSDLLWRYYPHGFPAGNQPTPSSPLDKTHLPQSLASDPRFWSREDVVTFLRWCEREFDLPNVDLDLFQMNGKAVCLLNKSDLAERCPGAGDVLHNVLQMLVRDAQNLQRCLPSSPVTPTSRHHYSLHQGGATTAFPTGANTWGMLASGATDFHAPNLAHLIQQGNSVTLSPAPSVDSQSAGSPQNGDSLAISYHSGSNGSNQSDSDEDSYQDPNGIPRSPPSTPGVTTPSVPQSPASRPTAAREFFPADTAEPNTNGRLLWDFLQQLLNDPSQRYTNFIAWKNRDTGVFKIVDPAGLAKLWGIQKNHLSMNYDKMSRALRYYYRVNILRKVQGERHCYQFLRNPSELKSIKNMSLLRQQMGPARPNASLQQQQLLMQQQAMAHITATGIKVEPSVEDDTAMEDLPTDLSMEHPTDLSPSRLLLNHSQNNSEYHGDIKQDEDSSDNSSK